MAAGVKAAAAAAPVKTVATRILVLRDVIFRMPGFMSWPFLTCCAAIAIGDSALGRHRERIASASQPDV